MINSYVSKKVRKINHSYLVLFASQKKGMLFWRLREIMDWKLRAERFLLRLLGFKGQILRTLIMENPKAMSKKRRQKYGSMLLGILVCRRKWSPMQWFMGSHQCLCNIGLKFLMFAHKTHVWNY